MAHERDRIKNAAKKYIALFVLQCIVTVGLIVCPTISVVVTSYKEMRPAHVYTLAGMGFHPLELILLNALEMNRVFVDFMETLIQTIMSGLTYYLGKKASPGDTNKKCGIFITIGIVFGIPEFAAVLVVIVMLGVFVGDGPSETNEDLAYAILAFTGLALLANILTIYMGCTLGNVLGANFNDSSRQVGPDTTRRGSGNWESRDVHLHIHGDQTAHIQQLQIQNSLLQQQLLLQQQQQLNNQQRRNLGGFDRQSPAPGYSENPPPYSSLGHTPSYIK